MSEDVIELIRRIDRLLESKAELVSLLREVRHYLPDGPRYSVLREACSKAVGDTVEVDHNG